MKEARVTLPELGLIAGTRAAIGAGLGLLLADRLSDEQRKAVGWTLLCVGILSTVPLAFEVFGHSSFPGTGLPEQAPDGRPTRAEDHSFTSPARVWPDEGNV